MKKTLVRFFGGVVMVCGALLGLSTSAHAQSIDISATPLTGSAHQSSAQVIRVTHMGGPEANNVTVTFTVPKGAKVDTPCQLDRFHGVRSYSCFVGPLVAGQWVDVPFSISMAKSGDVDVEVTCDQGTFIMSLSITIF